MLFSLDIFFVLTVGLFGICISTELNRLNDYIQHYDRLQYNTDLVHEQHFRAKRSAEIDAWVRLDFNALGRNFRLRLKRDTSAFSKRVQAEDVSGQLKDVDLSHIYTGYVYGEPKSNVQGSIIKGIFSGTIQVGQKRFHVEKTEMYFRDPQEFHSVIYNDDHLDTDPHREKRSAGKAGLCGATNHDVYEWMKTVQASQVEDERPVVKRSASAGYSGNSHAGMYSRQFAESTSRRQKRNTPSDDKRTCTLFLQSDPELWIYFTGKDSSKRQLGYSATQAEEEIAALFSSHVTKIKEIYENTVFNYSGLLFTGISFNIRRIRILRNDTDTCSNPKFSRFCEKNVDVANFLNYNSLTNHSDYCLAYMFTYRDFVGGTLGLAWVGSNTRASGGICEQYKEYAENNVRVWKSLNTGIVTLVNYNSRVPTTVSALTFAHEVGHNFGAQHDSGSECTPLSSKNDQNGNFIMFASATSGDKPNNEKFSRCSIENITKVLDSVIYERNLKKMCLENREAKFCGNSIVEEDEQCDCGYAPCDHDPCCHGRANSEGGDVALQCTRNMTASCSPSEGPCCSGKCQFVSSGICQAATECADQSTCNGESAACPEPFAKKNDTVCNEHTQICISGECTKSICEVSTLGWSQCYLSSTGDDDKENLCYVACKNPANDDCVSTKPDNEILQKEENKVFREFLQRENLTSTGIKLQPGAPCDNFQGYCDVFYRCRSVDADGPLSRLTNLIFNDQTYSDIRNWIVTYWWAVLLIGIAIVILMALFIHVCAVHTPSSNPNKPPPRKLTLPRRPRSQSGGPQSSAAGDRNRREQQPREGQNQGRTRSNQPGGRQQRSNRPATQQPGRRSQATPSDPSAPPPYSEIEMSNPKSNRV